MPYIICVNQPGCLPESDPVAVATIEEARDAALTAYDHSRGTDADDVAEGIGPDDPIRGAWLDHADAIETLPESGGVIGPLPDGYVIDVRHVTWDALARLTDKWAGVPGPGTNSQESILDAYNRN